MLTFPRTNLGHGSAHNTRRNTVNASAFRCCVCEVPGSGPIPHISSEPREEGTTFHPRRPCLLASIQAPRSAPPGAPANRPAPEPWGGLGGPGEAWGPWAGLGSPAEPLGAPGRPVEPQGGLRRPGGPWGGLGDPGETCGALGRPWGPWGGLRSRGEAWGDLRRPGGEPRGALGSLLAASHRSRPGDVMLRGSRSC